MARTEDAGDTWTVTKPNIPASPLFFCSGKTGWGLSAKGEANFLAETTDGGLTWKSLASIPIPASRSVVFGGLAFLDVQNGWAIGSQTEGLSYVVQTRDGGKTEQVVAELSGRYGVSRAVVVLPEKRIWLLGNESILYSEDVGRSWKQQLDPANLPGHYASLALEDAWINPDGHGLAVGESGRGVILKTNDFGYHWDVAFLSNSSTGFKSVSFGDSDHGCVVGMSTMLYCTADGGSTWTSKGTLPGPEDTRSHEEIIYSKIIFGKGGRRGWVLRALGFLYQTDDGGATWNKLDLLKDFPDER